jgi:uncharacterized membrane protein
MFRILFLSFCILISTVGLFTKQALSANIITDTISIVKARIISVEDLPKTLLPGFNTETNSQHIEAEILEGSDKGIRVRFTNDYIQLKKGDVFYLNHTTNAYDGTNYHSVSDPYRLPLLVVFAFVFIALVVWIGGKQGIRALIALAGSFAAIFYILIPSILSGYSPVGIALVVASLIIILGSYITHGFNKTTTTAVFGMILTILFTGGLAYLAMHIGKFTGYAGEDSVYLYMNSRGSIDMLGLLTAGIIIGLLGVLYDTAIAQAIIVEELHQIAPHVPKKEIFTRAMRVGREHIGATVDTLALAYAGASLPLLLLFAMPPVHVGLTANKEIFAAEIMRILIGSIGLIIAVPITTIISVNMLVHTKQAPKDIIEKELHAIKEHKHSH